MAWGVRAGAVTAAAILLSGCVAFGSIDRRATTIDVGVGDTLNRAMLINLARASRAEPLYFLSMSAAHGSATEDARLGLPAFTIGPKQALSQYQYTFGTNASSLLDSQVNTSFDVGVLNSKDFYAGLLAPLQLDDVNLLFSQGYSRQLVLYLVIDSLKITHISKDGDRSKDQSFILYNNPARPGFFAYDPHQPDLDPNHPTVPSPASFEGFIYEAISHGLATEAYMPLKKDDQPTSTAVTGSAPGVKVYISAEPSKGPTKDEAKVRLCYDYALANTKAMGDFDEKKSPRCGSPDAGQNQENNPSQVVPVRIAGEQYEIEVRTRSIFGIFNYLGALMNGDPAHTVMLRHYNDVPSDFTVDAPLLTVTDHFTDCFTAVRYANRNYCVPGDAANTKQIFNIINDLLALKTSPGDLPITQTVRLTQ